MQDTTRLPFYRRRWMAMLAAGAVFVALLLAALPLGIQYGLLTWLRDNGGEDVRLEDIDVNLFTGRATIEDLRLTKQGRELLAIPRLFVDVDWLPLFSRQVVLRAIVIEGVDLSIRQDDDGRMTVGGIALPAGGEDSEAPAGPQWQVGVDRLRVNNTTIDYQAPGLDVTIRLDELGLDGIKTWTTDPAPLTLTGAINGAALRVDGELPPLSQGFGYRGRLAIDALDLGTFATVAADAVADLAGRLTTDTQLDVLQEHERPVQVRQSGMLRVDDLRLAQAVHRVGLGDLQWDGDLDLVAAATPVVSASGRVRSSALAYDVAGSDYRLVRVAGLEAGTVGLQENGDISVGDLAMQGLVLARPAQEGADAVLTAGALDLDSLQVAGGNTRAGTLQGTDIVARLRRTADGNWQVARILETLPAEEAAANADADSAQDLEAAADQAQAAQFSLGAVHITGDSAIEMQDESVKPAFSSRLVLTDAEIRDIDSAQPEQDSPVSIEGRTGKHSRISVKGTVRPFAARPTLKLDNRLEGIALTDLSPYTVNMLGYALKSGALDVVSKLSIDHGIMDGDNKLTLRALEVAPVDNEARAQLESQLSLPLGTALDMLRDKNDTIALDLPVSGDIDKPDFDISDVVNTAVSKAVKKASMTYLTLALQPYGALISVAKLAGEAASRVQLAPVAFGPGSATQQAGSHDYLDKVAGILANRPELNIKVCGVANETDRATLATRATAALAEKPAEKPKGKEGEQPPVEAVRITDEQLLELAVQRAAAVTDYLVEKHAVNASRLVACQPSIDSTPAGKGRVDLLI
jgi:outer membrane protein OmpA-like peptidoglycan-associated protein